MKKRKNDLVKPDGSHPGETKTGVSPEHSDVAVVPQPKLDREAGRFPVVGIVALAGGLAAFETFLNDTLQLLKPAHGRPSGRDHLHIQGCHRTTDQTTKPGGEGFRSNSPRTVGGKMTQGNRGQS